MSDGLPIVRGGDDWMRDFETLDGVSQAPGAEARDPEIRLPYCSTSPGTEEYF